MALLRFRMALGSLSTVVVLFLMALSSQIAFAQVAMPGGAQYGIRIPSKIEGCYAPVASNLIGSNEQDHSGRGSPTLAYDWSASVGSPVFAMCPGTVRYTAAAENREMGGYGWHIVIDHGNGVSTLYAHCDRQSFMVEKGQAVTAWTPICRVGRTGMTSWPHIHLNVQVNGGYTKVGQYFDPSLIRYCHFAQCQATNKPDDPILADGQTVPTAQQGVGVGEARIYTLLRSLKGVSPAQLVSVYFVFFLTIGFLLWLGNNLVRMVVVGILTGAATALVIVWLFVPPLATAAPAIIQPDKTLSIGGDTWKAAFGFMRRWEGSSCTHDPVRTYKGVTNSTYNAWRQSINAGPGDVCIDMTDQQMEAIYYSLFWVKSGAYRLPAKTAIFMFDWYVNAGYGDGGSAKRALADCGADLACLAQRRLVFYQNCGTCSQGHFNRLRDIVQYLN